jgi:phosphohistidine phosphatase
MSDVRRRLVIVRHSKTEAYATTDHVRALTDRGKRDARELGRWLDQADVTPDLMLVSSAARAQQTADFVSAQLDAEPDVIVVDDLYSASPDEVIEICREHLDPSVEHAAVIGHNPTMAGLVDILIGSDTDEDLGHFPTSAAAVVEVDDWESLGEGAGTLVAIYRPKDHQQP